MAEEEESKEEKKARESNINQIDKIIATINPDKYYGGTKGQINTFKKLIKKEGFWVAVDKANPNPAAEHQLIYNSSIQTLEPVYFWILDFMNGAFKTEKLIDNFASSPGSGHFSELQGKISQMQQEASRVLGTVNNILKGVINLIYDLKEFKIRLSNYDAANSKDKLEAEAGLLGLKQIWMDRVDTQRGTGSILSMSAGNLQFVTLRDAFMVVNSIEEVDKLDLNERVKRVLKPRVQEFFEWKKRSEAELKKRYEIEKIYLKSQVDALKLNARWAKPYLKAAQQLSMNQKLAGRPELVNIFNTVFLQLTLMGISPLKVEEEVVNKDLPYEFKKMKLRKYNSVVFVDFNFRGIPSRIQQGGHYVFGGRAEVTFKAYALNDDEIELLKNKLTESDLNDSLTLIEGMTQDSLEQIKVDLDEFLGDKEKEKKEKEESEDINPFSALFSFFKKEGKDDKKAKKSDKIKPDSYAELYVRNFAEAKAINGCYTIFDVYKKAHDMASLPYISEAETEVPRSSAEELFGFGKENYQ